MKKSLKRILKKTKEYPFIAICLFAISICLLICLIFFTNWFYNSFLAESQIDSNKTSIEFSDVTFEKAVRVAISKPEGPIYCEDIIQITSLKITTYKNLTDITDIQYFQGLTKLSITGCSISDVSPLASLTSLTELNLTNNVIKDISPLCGLKYLKSLVLSGNQISSLPICIQNLYSLQKLNLSNNMISNIDNIMCCNNSSADLEKDLNENSLRISLRVLSLSNNFITSIETLDLPFLEELYLANNLLYDINFLRDNHTINTIDISYNNINDISTLATCYNLESVGIIGTEVSDISCLSTLKKFNTIYLDQDFDRTKIDFMIGNFRTGDSTTIAYLVAKNHNLHLNFK